jgi:hypothetical protein
MESDRDHPIIDTPCSYHLTEFRCVRDPAGIEEPFIDFVLERKGEVRRLRFLGLQELRLDGFPSASSLIIRDISARQLESLRVFVGEFDQDCGVPRFFAREVIDLDADSNSETDRVYPAT